MFVNKSAQKATLSSALNAVKTLGPAGAWEYKQRARVHAEFQGVVALIPEHAASAEAVVSRA